MGTSATPQSVSAASIRDRLDLSGRIAVITGGAGFLGIEFAGAMAEMGAVPVLLDLDAEALAGAAERVTGACNAPCESETANVTDAASLAVAVDAIRGRHGRIDVLVNAAALTRYNCEASDDEFFAPFESYRPDLWSRGMEVNLTGTMLACQAVGPVMAAQGKGSIINIASDVGVVSPDQRIYRPDGRGYEGVAFNTPSFYAVSKAGVIHLTKCLATEWAPSGVRVNALSPAGVFRDHDPGFVEKLSSRIPMGRMAREGEYNGAIVFLASDASSFMTGHNLVIDGGRTIW